MTALLVTTTPRTDVTPSAATNAVPASISPQVDAKTLIEWGFLVDSDGIDAHEDAASYVADAASKAGLRSVLVAVLANRSEPAAARARAFGRLSFALAG